MSLRELILVRHGESEGNVAREAAEAERAEMIAIDKRDADVPLTERGRTQAQALGRWLADRPRDQQPDVVWSSPYLRATQTAAEALVAAGLDLELHQDERLRDRELGILDRLTSRGIASRYPDEAARRRYLGKFYHRPPGGESWTDVALRLRSFLGEFIGHTHAHRALIVCHDAVVLLMRYVLEDLTEAAVLDIAGRHSVGNAAVTRLVRADVTTPWQVVEFNDERHLIDYGSEPTEHEAEQDVHPH